MDTSTCIASYHRSTSGSYSSSVTRLCLPITADDSMSEKNNQTQNNKQIQTYKKYDKIEELGQRKPPPTSYSIPLAL